MSLVLEYTAKAKKDLLSLDKKSQKQIVLKLRYYCLEDDYRKHIKSLTGNFKGLYRFRIGNFRAICVKDKGGKLIIITVISIKHRKEIYR